MNFRDYIILKSYFKNGDYSSGYEAGKKSEYDRFWDSLQQNGKRTSCVYLFSGNGWNEETFKPKYDIKPINATGMFSYTSSFPKDLITTLEQCGVELSFEDTTSLTSTFNSNTRIEKIGIVNTLSASSLSYIFGNCTNLKYIEKLVLRDNGTQTFSSAFANDDSLEHLIIEGVIGQNNFNVQWSTKLSHDSIVSIINALSTTTSGLTVTLSKTAVNNAFATGGGAGDGSTSQEWLDLIATKSNWTISLV